MNIKLNTKFFGSLAPIGYRTMPEPQPGLSFRHYRPDEMVLGKRMEDHLRFAVCYWHNFCYAGSDPFGLPTMARPWMNANTMDNARLKAEAAFEMFALLGVPFFCFHDRDVAPEGENFREADRNLWEIADLFAKKMGQTKLLWGTANLFSHPRYQAGAATNPDLDVFRMACAQVKTAMEVTHQLQGENYVLWGGREGYETLLNTDLKSELNQLGRFLCMVVDHKHKIGFKGTLLIEPKPQEPTKHQYDFDVNTVFAALQRWGLEKEVKVNIEVGHAFLANHSFEHEVATAMALGIFGSIDANRNDTQSGWDTDQFPNNVEDLTLAFYHLLKGGGFTTGGVNFDAKLRRQSIEPADLLHGHIGGMDTCAYALKAAARLVESAALENYLAARYRSWQSSEGQAILSGSRSLTDVAAQLPAQEPMRISGQQEYLENLVQRAVFEQ